MFSLQGFGQDTSNVQDTSKSTRELITEARMYRVKNDVENALKSYIKAERQWGKEKRSLKSEELYLEIALFFDSLSVNDKAREYFFDAYAQTKVEEKKSEILVYIAESFFKSGDAYLKEAIQYYLQALPIIQKENNNQKEVKILGEIANAYTHPEIGKLDTAFDYRKKILEIENRQKSPQRLASAWNNLAYTNRLIASREIKRNNRNVAADTLKSALKYIEKATILAKQDKNIEENRLITLLNLGVIEQSLGNQEQALKHLQEVLNQRKKQQNTLEIARTQNLIAKLHYYRNDYSEARIIANQALKNAKIINAKPEMQTSYEILADVHEKIADFRKLSRYKDSIYLIQSELTVDAIKQQQKQTKYKDIASDELEQALTQEAKEEQAKRLKADAEAQRALAQKAESDRQKAQAEAATARADAANAIILQQKAMAEKAKAEAEAEKQKAEKAKAEAETEKQKAEKQKAEADRKAAQAEKAKAEADKRNAEAKAEAAEKDAQNATRIFAFLAVLGFFVLVIIFILIFYYKNRHKNKLLTAQNDKIQQQNTNLEAQKKEIEKQRDSLMEMNEEIKQQNEEIEAQRDIIELEKEESEKLLLNILPQTVAYELKEKGTATPKSYEMVSVLFTDFKGFTVATEHMNPTEVIRELDKCFGAFDQICEKYGLEKIKTIGDAYMCAGGIPIENNTNHIDAVRAGLEIQAFMQNLRKEREARGEPYWELRLGINTGPLVAGVVGTKKFAYDIWGDTVNTAARMESSGVPNMVNISGATYKLIKDLFVCEYRGKLPAKNKGDVDMYFVISEK